MQSFVPDAGRWAIGVTTYMLLSGQRPFHHQLPAEKARMIREDPLKFASKSWDRISDDAYAPACRGLGGSRTPRLKRPACMPDVFLEFE